MSLRRHIRIVRGMQPTSKVEAFCATWSHGGYSRGLSKNCQFVFSQLCPFSANRGVGTAPNQQSVSCALTQGVPRLNHSFCLCNFWRTCAPCLCTSQSVTCNSPAQLNAVMGRLECTCFDVLFQSWNRESFPARPCCGPAPTCTGTRTPYPLPHAQAAAHWTKARTPTGKRNCRCKQDLSR